MSKENPRFFIVYAHADKDLYDIFLKLFIETKPVNWIVTLDNKLPLGANLIYEIRNALVNYDYIIVLLSQAFASSAFVKNELLFSNNKSKIIPVLLKPYQYTWDNLFKEFQTFLYSRKNTNSISFEEWLELRNKNKDLNNTFFNFHIRCN